MRLRHLLAPAFLCGAAAAPLGGQVPRPVPPVTAAQLARVDRLFADAAGLDRPGYAVGIVQDGRLVHARGFGAADVERGVPIEASTVFDAASLAKQFTAACVGILVRRGRIRLDDEVRRHLPEMPDYPEPVRIEHLVYMTSGLREYYTLPRPGGLDWERDRFTVADAIAATFAQPRLAFRPGERWAYSNVNYMILAELVSRVSGMPFSEFARREIFAPLGMTSTRVDDDLRVVPRQAAGHNERADGGWRRETRRSPHYGGSGLFTTVEDLARWDRAFETHALGGPELTRLLLSTRRYDHPKANDAFGLVWGEHRGRRTLWYEGGDLGFSSYMVRLPDDRLTVVVLSNFGTGAAAERARRILDVLVPRESTR
jgi:CubicO group peptidase (beta-lactamase class C family)